MMTDCFAYMKSGCRVLNVRKCEGKSCPFMKTKEQLEENRLKVMKRIRSLDDDVVRYIIETYYGGKMELLSERGKADGHKKIPVANC